MKIYKFLHILFVFLFCHLEVFSQLRHSYLFPNIYNQGQLGSETCWAGTIQLLSNIYSKDSTVQCKLIESEPTVGESCCNTSCNISEQVKGVSFSSLLNRLKLRYSNFTSSSDISTIGFDTLNKSFPLRGNYSISKNDNLSYKAITESFDLYNSPLVLFKFFDSVHAHIVSVVGHEHTIDTLSNKQLKWLFVQDPWPRRNGSHYLMSYEYYKRKVFNKSKKDIKYEYEPNKALVYNLVTNVSNPVILKENSILLNKIEAINIVTNVQTNKYKTATFQANKILNHFNKNSSDAFMNFIGIERNKSEIEKESILNVISLDNILQYYVSAVYLKNDREFTPSNWFDAYIMLFSQKNEVLITIRDSNNRKKKIAVIAIDTTKNKEWYVSRIEPFKTSIMSVVEDLHIDKKDVKIIVVNKAVGEYPDFFIVNFKSSKKPVYVDLSGQNELGLTVDTQGNTGVFKYKASKIDGKNKAKISAYLSPSFATKINQTYKVTNASKDFIKSFNELIKITPDSILKLKNDDCPYNCKVFTTESIDFDSIVTSPKISFISSFNVFNDADKNSFLIPLIDDSFRPVNSIVHLYENIYSTNCNKYYKIDSTFHFSKKGFIDDHFQQIIFVPVVKYKTLPNKKFDDSDYTRLQECAISPVDMRKINDPFIESNDGYLANINTHDIKDYNDKKSITGIVCDVVLKDSTTVQCYLFNKQSFDKSSPYMKWKK